MDRAVQSWRLPPLMVLSLALAGLPARAQEKPLSLSGEVTTGFFSSKVENSQTTELSSVPVNLKLFLSGFLGHPDFLSFRVDPVLSAGTDAREINFVNGNGVSLGGTFLRRRALPLTFRYTNLQLSQVDIGGLGQLAGVRSDSHIRDFGVSSKLQVRHLPPLLLHYDMSDQENSPQDHIQFQGNTGSRRYGVSLNDKRWGWTTESRAEWEKYSNEFVNLFAHDLRTATIERNGRRFEFEAGRPLMRGVGIQLSAGKSRNRETFDGRPFPQDMGHLNASLSAQGGERWSGSLSAGYVSYSSGLTPGQVVENVRSGAAEGAKETGLLGLWSLSNQQTISTFAGQIHFMPSRGWRLFGGANRIRQRIPWFANDLADLKTSNYLSTQGGVSFSRRSSWGDVSAQYTLNLYHLGSSAKDVRLLATDRLGHGIQLQFHRGAPERVEFTGSFGMDTQSILGNGLLGSSGRFVDFSLRRRVRNLLVGGSVGIRRSSLRVDREYHTEGLTVGAQIQHRLFDFAYSRNGQGGGYSLPFLGSSADSYQDIGPSDVTSLNQTVNLNITVWRFLRFRLLGMDAAQNLANRFTNSYRSLVVGSQYRFRLLDVEAGYLRYEQTFLSFKGEMRGSIYLRVSRQFRAF